MYITKYSCVFLKLGESIYVYTWQWISFQYSSASVGSLPLAHNAQHSLVIPVTDLLAHDSFSPVPSRIAPWGPYNNGLKGMSPYIRY